jgi:hypothetical protein
MRTLRILVLGGIATSLGCTPPFEKICKKHGPLLEARLAQVAAVGKAVEALPFLTSEDERIPVPAGAVSGSREGGLKRHVAFMYREAFADLTDHGPSFARLPGSNPFNVCASLLRKQRCPQGCESSECMCYHGMVELHFAACEAIEYLLVIRTHEFGEPGAPAFVETRLVTVPDARALEARPVPKPDLRAADLHVADGRRQDGGVAPDSRKPDARVREHWTFRGGMARGEVHVYELASAKRLGGFLFLGMSPLIEVGSRSIDELRSKTSAEQLVLLKRRFVQEVQQAIRDESKRRIPTAFSY